MEYKYWNLLNKKILLEYHKHSLASLKQIFAYAKAKLVRISSDSTNVMKIAFLNIYQNKVNRGAETFINELSKRLAKNNQVDVISDVNYFNLIKNKYDIVIPTNGRSQVFIVRLIAWLVGSKVVVSGQSGAGFDDRVNLYSFPDAFIGLTNYQSIWAKKINPFVKIKEIPNGVDLSVFTTTTHLKNTVLSVGAFTKEKRHGLTIRAISKLENINLKIVGSGGEIKDEITDLGKKLLGSRFEVISVSHSEMPKIYRSASVLAFPTVPWESFGIVLVEAMASGLPVVTTNDPIRQEIIGNAGILVDPTDTDDYVNALQTALNKNWGDEPRKQAEKFSWDDIADQYEKLFKTLLNTK